MVLFFSRRQLPSTYLVAACLFLLLSLLFSLVACQAPVNTTEGGTESGTSAPETAPHTTLTVPETTSAPKPIPEDPAAFDGVLIHSVYGTGKNGKDAVISCGFIQLYNESDRDISLHRASLYYKTDNGAGFTEFALPEDAVIPSQGYYLLRSNPASGFSEENAILAIGNADATFPILIDHKEITLILAPSYREFDPTLPYDAFEDINSIFAASDTPTDFHYAVHDLSRNKIAVRTAPTAYSGFHTVNLTKRATAELTALTPKTASGAVNRVVASRLDEVFFSAPAGFYPQTLLLSLSCKDGYTVYYTLDGSDP
ncbi:MAG: chitobiase/beta-hexosaminidase C-terminal domain-containing protein, partial [Clostridia bacterium]|nr:chitobiase/beta-hexosaminidase C-terminal domain-containing protein [Clostridia bacterium]